MVKKLLFVIAAGCATGLGGVRGPTCAVELTPFGPGDDLTYLLALARSDTVLAGPGPVRATGAEGHWGRADGDSLGFGQVFRVRGYGGAGALLLDSALAGDTVREIVTVLWDYDAACEPTAWSGSARWAFPDSSVFFSARLRDRSFWVGGRPTFDSFFAGELAYPFDVLTQSVGFYVHLDSVGLPYRKRTDRLTAAEVYRLVDDLPKPCDWRARPAEARRALAVAKERHRAILGRFPANVILADHARWARGASGSDGNGAPAGTCGP